MLRSRHAFRVALAVALGCLTFRTSVAQDTPSDSAPAAAQTARDTAFVCDGLPVSWREIRRTPPSVVKSAPRWARGLVRPAIQHRTSRESAVRPFLRLDVGETCSEFELRESERLLRAQPYIADARIQAIPDGVGGVRIEVETEDEIPVILDGRLRGTEPTRIRYGSTNVLGHGIYAHLQWQQGDAFRDGWSIRARHFHVFDRPYVATLVAGRRPLGEEFGISLGQPWLTPYQPRAFHAEFRHDVRYPEFVRPSGSPLSLRVEHRFASVGGVVRLGSRERRTFGGFLLTHDRLMPGSEGLLITRDGFGVNDDPTLDGRYRAREATRIGPVLGARWLSYTEARGFDALEGTQDIARGLQLALFGGLGVGGESNNILAADLYAGYGNARSFVGGRWDWQAERDDGSFANIVSSGRIAWYLKMAERRTLITSAEFSGAWRDDVPYQLLLGSRASGVRGYSGSRLAGARRLVVRGEHRWLLPGFRDFLGTGVAAFADVGRIWGGDVPYGRAVTARPSAGVSLLAAIPRDSRRLIRVDVAVPLAKDAGADSYEIRFQFTQPLRGFWRTPPDLATARGGSPTSRIFGWP